MLLVAFGLSKVTRPRRAKNNARKKHLDSEYIKKLIFRNDEIKEYEIKTLPRIPHPRRNRINRPQQRIQHRFSFITIIIQFTKTLKQRNLNMI